MALLMALVIGLVFAAGTFLMLQPGLIRLLLGMSLISNGANLVVIACGGFSPERDAPFVEADASGFALTQRLMDPLPPDIILTAIVINFAVTALFLTVCYRAYRDTGEDDPDALGVMPDPEDRNAP